MARQAQRVEFRCGGSATQRRARGLAALRVEPRGPWTADGSDSAGRDGTGPGAIGRRCGARTRGFGAVVGQSGAQSHDSLAFVIAHSQQRCEENETGLRQLSSPLHSYNDRIRLLDKLCSLYAEKKERKKKRGEF